MMNEASDRKLRLGTRASALALWQSNWVASQLRDLGFEVELVEISTQGDVRGGPIGAIGSQGVFTKEIQRALLEEEVDFAVHSLLDDALNEPQLCFLILNLFSSLSANVLCGARGQKQSHLVSVFLVQSVEALQRP